jgi:hypothetical protein
MEIKGFTYGFDGERGDYRSKDGIKSQELLYETGVNWICLAVLNHQKNFYSTDIKFDFATTPTDRDIAFAVEKAHAKGIKICLKPILNSEDFIWRAYISFPDEDMGEKDQYWGKWFKSYTAYMLHYAELAEELKVGMLCIGCEMSGTEQREKQWRKLIKKIRKVYSGKLVYNANHGREKKIAWFDAIDYIGTSAYYQVGLNGAGKADMIPEWEKVRKRLNKISDKLEKKYIFMEVGCRSAKGCAAMPWDFTHTKLPYSEEEQANFYESCLKVFSKEPRFAGVFWWDWSTFIYNDEKTAKKDTGFNIHLKKAEDVIKKYYSQ